MATSGKGSKTLQIVAKHADEWNFTYVGVQRFMLQHNDLDDLDSLEHLAEVDVT